MLTWPIMPGDVLGGVRAGRALVVAQRCDARLGERLGEQAGAAVGAGQQRGAPVAVGRAAPGDEHHRGERALTSGPGQGGVHGDLVELPGHLGRGGHCWASP